MCKYGVSMRRAGLQGLNLVSYGKEHVGDLEQLRFLKLQAVKWQMALSLGLAASLVVARLLSELPLPSLQ